MINSGRVGGQEERGSANECGGGGGRTVESGGVGIHRS